MSAVKAVPAPERRLWSDSARVGLFLACVFAAGAVLTAYLPLWLADRGLGASLIGEVLGLAALCRVVAVPGWGWFADRLGRHRAALCAASLCACGCAALLPAAAGVPAIALFVIVGGVAASALAPLGDAVTLALAAAGRLDYGRTRVWGSVAYMLATAAGGALLGAAGSKVVPWALAVGYGAAATLTAVMPQAGCSIISPGARTASRTVTPGPLGPAFRWTLLATALIQGSHAAYYGFASLHWRAAGIADGVIGLLIGEGIIAEIALFLWGRRLVEWLGPARLTTVAATACILRWTATALTVSVPLLAAVQLLHAATFACQHLSSMLVLRTLPAARSGWAQTLLAALGFSAPTGVLVWVSGQIYGAAGGRAFLLMAALGALALLVAPSLPGGARRR